MSENYRSSSAPPFGFTRRKVCLVTVFKNGLFFPKIKNKEKKGMSITYFIIFFKKQNLNLENKNKIYKTQYRCSLNFQNLFLKTIFKKETKHIFGVIRIYSLFFVF